MFDERPSSHASRNRGSAAGEPTGALSPGKRSLVEALPIAATANSNGPATQVQRLANHAGRDDAGVHEAARRGTSGGSEALPFLPQIQSLFGRHDVTGVDPEAGSVRKARAQAALKSVVARAATPSGGGTASGYDLKGKQKNEPTEYQNWQVRGVGAGNRAGDVPGPDGKVKNASQGGVKPAQVNLSNLKFDTSNAGDGAYHEHGADAKGWSDKRKDKLSYDGEHPSVDIWGGSATAGARQKLGARVNTDAKGSWGNASAGADADLVAEAGANVNAKLNSDGFTAGAAASARAGAEASATASYQTPGLAIKGVDKPLTASVDANADAFAGARAGIEGKAGISKDFVGVKGSAGAFAGVEGSLEGKASAGPVSATAGISGLAGAGIGADASIAYEDGHLRIGGRLYASLGLGGSVETSVDIDLKQAVQLGIVTAREAHDLADADGDGRITLNDGATQAASAMTGTAAALDRGVDATLHTLDANHDGKIDGKDATYAATHAWGATKQGTTVAWDATRQTLDRNHDGKIDGADVAAGASQAGHAIAHGAKVVGDLAEKGASKIKGALDHDGDGRVELSDIAAHLGDVVNAALRVGQHAMESVARSAADVRDVVSHGVKKTAQAAHGAADLNHDGKVDTKDVRKLAQDALHLVENVAHDVKAHAADVARQAYDAMDLNQDGKIDVKDAAVAKQHVAARVATMKKATSDALHGAVEAGHRAVEHLKAEIKLTAKRVFDAADLSHDGKVDANDAVVGAKQASAAMHHEAAFVAKEVADGAKQLYDGAASQAKQAGTTLKHGFDDAKRILAGTWAKVRSFS